MYKASKTVDSSFFNDAKGATSQAPDAPDKITVNPVTGSQAVPQTKQKVGHECEFVEGPPKQFQSECSICLVILREPHLISCCGHSFCEVCIGRIREDGKPCPLCNKPGYTTLPNQGLQRALNEFGVRCSHRELGCEWVGNLGNLDGHLNTEPQPDCQLVGCKFVEVECIHCKKHLRRLAIEVHQNECCPKRPYTCEYCKEYESTFEDVAFQHYAECKHYCLPCPNKCCLEGSGIERQALDHHVQEDCPLEIVGCSLHYAGCEVRLPRKDLASHMREDASSHVALLAAENQRMAKQLLEKGDQVQESIQQFTKENADLRSYIDEMKQELASYRQHTTRELAESTDTLQHTAKEIDTLKQNFAECQLTIRQLEENVATLKEKHTPKAKDPVIAGASDVSSLRFVQPTFEHAYYQQQPSANSPEVGDAPSEAAPQWQQKYSERHYYQPQPSTSSPIVRPDVPSKRSYYQPQPSTSSPVVRDAPSSKAVPRWTQKFSDWHPK